MSLFKAEKVKGKDLKPGEAFSTACPDYWEKRKWQSLGEKVYLRTNSPCPEKEADQEIYRITVTKEG